MIEMRSVFSSHVSAVGYDSGTMQLAVKFNNGKTAIYSDVPSDVAQLVTDAPSVGSAIHRFLKGKYAFGYLPEGQ